MEAKYRYERDIMENMDDLMQLFALRLLSQGSLWGKMERFDTPAAFLKVEFDFFIDEMRESYRRDGYPTLARWVREALRGTHGKETFNEKREEHRFGRGRISFGLVTWTDGGGDFGNRYGSWIPLQEKIQAAPVAMCFDPLTQTKPEYKELVERGRYACDIDTQICVGAETLMNISACRLTVDVLISGFKMFWLKLDGALVALPDDIAAPEKDATNDLSPNARKRFETWLESFDPIDREILAVFTGTQEASSGDGYGSIAERWKKARSTIAERKQRVVASLRMLLEAVGEEERLTLCSAVVDAAQTKIRRDGNGYE